MPGGEVTRISVPSIDSWNLVKENIAAATRRALADALPDPKDATRRAALQKELAEWQDRMFALAAPNLRVNGQKFEEYVEKPRHLPFDEVLDRTVTALREQSLVSEQTIAERRRNVPAQVRNLLVDLLERQRAAEVPLNRDEPSIDSDEDFSFIAQYRQLEEDDAEIQLVAKQLNTTVPHLLQRAQWAQEVSSELSGSSASAPTHTTR